MRHARAVGSSLMLLSSSCGEGAHAVVHTPPRHRVAAEGPAEAASVDFAPPPGASRLLGAWYLRDQGLRRVLRVDWDERSDAPRATLATDVPFDEQAPVTLDVLRWDEDGALTLRRREPTDGTADWYALRVGLGVVTGRVAARVAADVSPSPAAFSAHVTGWNLAAMDRASEQRTWDLLLDGRERATLRIDRTPGGVTAWGGTLKVYATVARGIEDEGRERDIGVLRWSHGALVFFTQDGGVRQYFSATVAGRHIRGRFIEEDGASERSFTGARRDVLGYGLAARSPAERDAWSARARGQLERLIMAGNPRPTAVDVVTLAAGIGPYGAATPNPTRDDDPRANPQRYTLSEHRIDASLPAAPGEPPLRRQTRVMLAKPEGAAPPGGWPVAVVLNGHWGSARQTFIPNSPYWYGDAFARRGYLVVAVDISHRPPGERGGLYADIPDGDSPSEGNGPTPALRHSGMDSDWEEDGERAWDVMRALDLALSQTGADRARVALVGLSMGGEVASIAGALDTRFTAVVPAGFSPDVAVYQYRHHPCWDWVHADVNEYVDVSDYHAMIAPRALVVETGVMDTAYSVAAEPFAADKQVLRRSRAAFVDAPERVVHFLHPASHSFQAGDARVDGAAGSGLTAPLQVAPSEPWSQEWQVDAEARPVAPSLFEYLSRVAN